MSAAPMKLEHGLLMAITITLLTLTAGALQHARASGPCSEGGCSSCQGDCGLTSCEVDEQTGNVIKCIYDCEESCGGGGGGGGGEQPGG
jgi:hypothetical protein